MRKLVVFATIVLPLCCGAQNTSETLKLWYDHPAESWNEALPVGNGTLGAMIFGGIVHEHIQFNEETLWTGAPHDYAHKGAMHYLDTLRLLLNQGKQEEAHELAMDKFMSTPLTQKEYQPFGDLYLDFPDHQTFSDYRRELDIASAICRTSYRVDDICFTREVIASFPSKVIAIQLNTDRPGSLNFDLWLGSEHKEHSLKTMQRKTGFKCGRERWIP